MTQKQKAIELVEKFEDENLHFSDDILESEKHHAIICVDDIISACEYNRVEPYNTTWWNKVKEEINKL